MSLRFLLTVLVTFVFLALGCGYFDAGLWEDDPGNWRRAFQSTAPADVVVVHSRYWRSPHWSYEFQYFFEIAPNATLQEQLFTENRLRQLSGAEAVEARGNVFGDPPAWFAPKNAADYDVWVFDDAPERNFNVLVERNTGVMFLHDYQV
jgi:hypothetical protein